MATTHRWILEMSPFENGVTFNAAASQLLLTIALLLAGLLLTYVGLRVLKTTLLMAAAGLGGWASVLLVSRLNNTAPKAQHHSFSIPLHRNLYISNE